MLVPIPVLSSLSTSPEPSILEPKNQVTVANYSYQSYDLLKYTQPD